VKRKKTDIVYGGNQKKKKFVVDVGRADVFAISVNASRPALATRLFQRAHTPKKTWKKK
jgi:hypothetical protein